MSPNTGHAAIQQKYGTNPYQYYDNLDNQPYSRYFEADAIDVRLPAMERIIDIYSKGKYKIYPFSSIKKKGVINDQFEGKQVVLFYQSGMVSILDKSNITESKDIGSVTVFNAILEGQKLTFRKKRNKFIDDQTQSEWDITGLCLRGPLQGKQLQIEAHSNHFAFAWLAFYPDSQIYGEYKD